MVPNFRVGSQFSGVESKSMHTAATHFTIPGLTRNPWWYHSRLDSCFRRNGMPNFRVGSQFSGVESKSMHTAATHFTIPGLTRNPWRYHSRLDSCFRRNGVGDTTPDWIHGDRNIPGLTRNPLEKYNTASMDQSVVKSPALSISLTLFTSSQCPFM